VTPLVNGVKECAYTYFENGIAKCAIERAQCEGKIDFKKTAVMLSCRDCFDDKIFRQKEVSALDVAKANLPVRIYDVIIYP